MKKKILYIICALLVVFSVSSMSVAINHLYFEDTEYSPVSTITIGTLTVFGLAYSLRISLLRKTRSLMVIVVTCLLCWCIINVLICPSPGYPTMKLLGYVSLWETMFLLFYNIALYRYRYIKTIKVTCLIILFVNSALFVVSRGYRTLTDFAVSSMGNNMIFYVITLIPFILLSENRKWKLLAMIFVSALSVLSFKRSVLIIISLILVVFIYYNYYKPSKNKSRNILMPVVGALMFMAILLSVNYYSDGIAVERLNNIEQDKGNGRLGRWENISNILSTSYKTKDLIIGKGFRYSAIAVGKFSGTAHNDFLEVFCDYGIIGLCLYVLFHLLVIRRMIFFIKTGSEYRLSYVSSYIVFFVMSMVSHLIIYPTYFVFLAIYWGIMEVVCMRIKGINKIKKKILKDEFEKNLQAENAEIVPSPTRLA